MSSTGLSIKIAEYIADRAQIKISNVEKKKGKSRVDVPMVENSTEHEKKSQENFLINERGFQAANWLADAARRAGQIRGVTHVLKFTNTSAEGSSFYAPQEKDDPMEIHDYGIVGTFSLVNQDLDFVGNAAALDVAKLLLIQDEGKFLIDCIKEGDMSPFAPFSDNESQLNEWREGFMKIWADKELASHTFSKQVYFPIGEGRYHLLSPLHASSFVHEIYKQVSNSKFSDQAKFSRQAKETLRYSSTRVIKYPNIAIQKFGGTKPQNVSQLNSIRGGKLFLLSCAPPAWKECLRPPLETPTIFSSGHFGRRVRKEISELREYLNDLHLNKNTKLIRDFREDRINNLIDQLIHYGVEIRNLPGVSGWSALPQCKLSLAEQLWLDPYRVDDNASVFEFKKGDWKEIIADRFAHWLNLRLKTKKLHFGDVEYREWKDLMEKALEVFV